MAVQNNGTIAPAGTDPFLPDADMRALAGSFKSRIRVPAVNTAARTAMTSTCGWTPTAAEPLMVFQTDTQVLWLYDGTNWIAPYQQPSACRSIVSATQTLTASTPYSVLFAGTDIQQVPAGLTAMHSTSTNTDKIYVRVAGRYDVAGMVQVAGQPGNSNIQLQKNGTTFLQVAYPFVQNGQGTMFALDTIACSVGDYFTLVAVVSGAGCQVGSFWPSTLYVKWVSI